MKGLYLYGICPVSKKKKSSDINMDDGIGGGLVFYISYQDIKAIVSEVSLGEFGSAEIQKRATDDLEWIKDKALMHEKILETAANNSEGQIIPMKFGTIFKDREGLTDSLKKNYLKFKDLLKNLRGKEERSVKIYLKYKLLENEIKKNSPTIQSKLEKIKYLPAGHAYRQAGRQYFLEEEINEMVKREAKKSANSYIPLFLEKIKGSAEELKENKILGKELTQRKDPMVFNGAFLVKKERADRFQEEIKKLQAEYGKIGFTFEPSGPWPPYNFV